MYYRNRETQRRLKKLNDGPGKKYMCGVWYNDKKRRYVRYYLGDKLLKHYANKRVRQHIKRKDFSMKGNEYRKISEYWWSVT